MPNRSRSNHWRTQRAHFLHIQATWLKPCLWTLSHKTNHKLVTLRVHWANVSVTIHLQNIWKFDGNRTSTKRRVNPATNHPKSWETMMFNRFQYVTLHHPPRFWSSRRWRSWCGPIVALRRQLVCLKLDYPRHSKTMYDDPCSTSKPIVTNEHSRMCLHVFAKG